MGLYAYLTWWNDPAYINETILKVNLEIYYGIRNLDSLHALIKEYTR